MIECSILFAFVEATPGPSLLRLFVAMISRLDPPLQSFQLLIPFYLVSRRIPLRPIQGSSDSVAGNGRHDRRDALRSIRRDNIFREPPRTTATSLTVVYLTRFSNELLLEIDQCSGVTGSVCVESLIRGYKRRLRLTQVSPL